MEKLIYFDHAATSWPKPQRVIKAISSSFIEKSGNPGRSGHILSLNASKAIYECREAVCNLFSYNNPERVIFTQNTTHALNLAIKGILSKGDHIVISNFEHNSVSRPVFSLSNQGITHTVFDANDTEDEYIVYDRVARKDHYADDHRQLHLLSRLEGHLHR